MSPTRLLADSRLRDGLRSLAGLATTPMSPADIVDLIDPLWSPTDLRARIVAIEPAGDDAATLVLRPGRPWRRHLAGQYVGLGVDVDGIRHWRSYSLTSVPDAADKAISITVQAIPGGTVSQHLVHEAQVGDVLQLEHADGDFHLPVSPPERVLFVAAGSGVTPVLGMLRTHGHALDDAIVIHIARDEDRALHVEDLRALTQRHGLTLIEHRTASAGRLDGDGISALVPDLRDRDTWACGPAGLLDALEEHYARQGIADRLHVERFRPATVEAGDGGTAVFGRADRTVAVDGTTSLLDAGEEAGVLMPSGCRMGICFGCVVPLKSGAIRDLRTGEVTEAPEGRDLPVQTCISTAAGPCELDV